MKETNKGESVSLKLISFCFSFFEYGALSVKP